MFPLFSIILALSIALSYPAVVKSPHPPDIVGTAVVVLLVGAMARVLLSRAARRALLDPDGDAEPMLRLAAIFRPGIVIAFAGIVYQLHWPAVVTELGIEHWILVDEAVILLPFVLMLMLVIDATGRAEQRLRLHDFSAGAYLSFNLRQFLLPVAPVAFFLLLKDVVEYASYRGVGWVTELLILLEVYPFLRWIGLAGLLLLLYGMMPFMLKWSFKATSLPAGPLRRRLDAFSVREKFKARDILLWPTGGNVVNAAVIGIAGPLRFVLITDALVDELSEDEVEAVFAHEVGHARNHHMLLFFFFTLAYGLLTYLILENLPAGVMTTFSNPEVAQLIFGLVGFVLWFFIVFGFVSRRFEQQADVYGALSTGRGHGDPDAPAEEHPFVRALTGLRRQMGDVRESKGWRHFPISERISYLIEFLKSEGVRRSYRIRMRVLLIFFIGTLVALWTAAAATIPAQLREGGPRYAQIRAQWYQSKGERLRAYFVAREYREESIRNDPEPHRERALRQHQLLWSGGGQPQVDIEVLTDLSATYMVLYGPTPSRKVLSQALDLNLELRSMAMFLAAANPFTRERALEAADELAGQTTVLLTLLGDALEREGRPIGARLAFQDARAALPPDHPDRDYLTERIERIDAGS